MTLPESFVSLIAGLLLALPTIATADQAAGLGGNCPVSYFEGGKPRKGDPAITVDYIGTRFLFCSDAAKSEFQKSPERFLPRFGGLCACALGGSYGNRLDSDPEVFYVIDNNLYLFSSLRARNAFDRDPPGYLRQCEERYPGLGGFCPVSYFAKGEPVKGDAAYRVETGPFGYRFASEEAKKAFLKDPAKYTPQYNGYCAAGVARQKMHPGDPKFFAVINDKLYVFWDEATRVSFLTDKDKNIRLADTNWPVLTETKKGH